MIERRIHSRRQFLAVRRAKHTDLEAIAHVHGVTWQACYRGLMHDEFLDSLSFANRESMWHKALDQPGHPLFICRSERRTVGFVASGPSRDQDKDASTVAELYAIYVFPDYWGQGCAKFYGGAPRGILRGQNPGRSVCVLGANERARKYYEREGCQVDPRANKDAHIGGIKLRESVTRNNCATNLRLAFPKSLSRPMLAADRRCYFSSACRVATQRQRSPIFPVNVRVLPFCRTATTPSYLVRSSS